MFGHLIDEGKKKSSEKISYLKVARDDSEWYLKRTESSMVIIQPYLNIELRDKDKEFENISANIKVTVPITSVDFHPTISFFKL